jgi:hypothetical protein
MAKKNDFRLVNPKLLSEILRKKMIFDSLSESCVPCATNQRQKLRDASMRHSVEMELENRAGSSTEKKLARKRESRRCMKNLSNALEWGTRNYSGTLSDYFISSIAEKVEPELNTGYRTERVLLPGTVSHEKIEDELSLFLFQNSCLKNKPLEKALNAHLHIARIHPFWDGNGRTARLVQDLMLESEGFFPIILKPEERKEYMGLVEEAKVSYNQQRGVIESVDYNPFSELTRTLANPEISLVGLGYCRDLALDIHFSEGTPEQRRFYNFLAEHMLNDLNEVIGNMSQKGKKNKRCCRGELVYLQNA